MLTRQKDSESNHQNDGIDRLRQIVDDLLLGNPVSSIDKSIHPQLVPILQERRNKAFVNGDKQIEHKIDIIMKNLTLTPSQNPKTKKKVAEKNYYSFRKIMPVTIKPEVCNELIQKLLVGTKLIEELDKNAIQSILQTLKQMISDASKAHNYTKAGKLSKLLNNVMEYSRKLHKIAIENKNKSKSKEYIEHLKELYHEALIRKNKIYADFNKEFDKLNEQANASKEAILEEYYENLEYLHEEEKKIGNLNGFQPSMRLDELKSILDSKKNMDLTEKELEYIKTIKIKRKEQEQYEHAEFIKAKKQRLKADFGENEKKKNKKLEALKASYDDQRQQINQKRKLVIDNCSEEIKSIKAKFEGLGIQPPVFLDIPVPKSKQANYFIIDIPLDEGEKAHASRPKFDRTEIYRKKISASLFPQANTENANSNVNSNENTDKSKTLRVVSSTATKNQADNDMEKQCDNYHLDTIAPVEKQPVVVAKSEPNTMENHDFDKAIDAILNEADVIITSIIPKISTNNAEASKDIKNETKHMENDNKLEASEPKNNNNQISKKKTSRKVVKKAIKHQRKKGIKLPDKKSQVQMDGENTELIETAFKEDEIIEKPVETRKRLCYNDFLYHRTG